MDRTRRQIERWGKLLEDGQWDDPTLQLVHQLQARRLATAVPSPDFVEELRRGLMAVPPPDFRRLAAWLLPAIVLLAAGVIAVLTLVRAEPASAADVFEQANQHYGSLAQTDGILHTKLTLTYNDIDHASRNVVRQYSWNGEIWEDLSSPDFRHQLIGDQGEFHYFSERHGSQYWRSTYPVVGTAVDQIYRLTEAQYYANDDGSTNRLAPIFGNLIDWLGLDGWWIAHGEGCENPFCAIGLEAGDFWRCDTDRCVAHLSAAIGDVPAADLEVKLTGQEQLVDGRTVDAMEIRYSIGDELIRELKFDAETHEMVEMVSYWMGVQQARIVFVDREILSADQSSLFTALPRQLRESTWELDEPPRTPWLDSASFPGLPQGTIETIWLSPTVVQPGEGSTLRAGDGLAVYLRVGGAPLEDLEVTAQLCSVPPPSPPGDYGISACNSVAAARQTVSKRSGTTRVAIPIAPDDTWPEQVWLALTWNYSGGESQRLWFPDYFWYVER